jgi:hypothetical protein
MLTIRDGSTALLTHDSGAPWRSPEHIEARLTRGSRNRESAGPLRVALATDCRKPRSRPQRGPRMRSNARLG